MYPRPSFHREAVIANIQPIRVASEIWFRSVWSNPPTPPTVVRSRFCGLLWPGQDGKIVDLGTLGGSGSEAMAINDSGYVTVRPAYPATRNFMRFSGVMEEFSISALSQEIYAMRACR